MKDIEDIFSLSDLIRETSFDLHNIYIMGIWKKYTKTVWRIDCGIWA